MELPQTIQDMTELGRVIAAQRKRLQMKQAEAAGLLGVGVRFLSELERGKETISMGKALEVLHALGLTLQIDERK